MTIKPPNRNKLKTLNQQINLAELRLQHDQRMLAASTSQLVKDVQRKLAAPSSLLLTVCFGFICGEFSQYRTPDTCNARVSSFAEKNSIWSSAISTITFINTLYSTLPLILSFKFYFKSSYQNKVP